MKIYIVDNGGQWTHREWRVLRYLGVESKIIPNTTPLEKIGDVDALILSGGAPSIASDPERMGNNGDYLDNLDCPVFGICAGMQFMSTHFGGDVRPGTVPEFGAVELKIDDHECIFKGLPSEFIAWASHNDEIKKVPNEFVVTAHSPNCLVEGIRHKKRPLYGVQFHPEVEHTEYGNEIFKNFVDIVRSRRV